MDNEKKQNIHEQKQRYTLTEDELYPCLFVEIATEDEINDPEIETYIIPDEIMERYKKAKEELNSVEWEIYKIWYRQDNVEENFSADKS